METFLASGIITDFNALDKSVSRPVFLYLFTKMMTTYYNTKWM